MSWNRRGDLNLGRSGPGIKDKISIADSAILLPHMNLQHRGMIAEEKKALSFVAILIGLSIVARAANRPDPVVVAGASAVELSARLEENQRVRDRPEVQSKPRKPTSAPSAPALVDVNRATIAELDALPGIGPAVAQRIVEYREAKGRFTSYQQLDSVKGIGPALLERLKPRIRF